MWGKGIQHVIKPVSEGVVLLEHGEVGHGTECLQLSGRLTRR